VFQHIKILFFILKGGIWRIIIRSGKL
jgi:hypothetical protein